MVEGTRKNKVNKGKLAFAIIVLILAIFVVMVVKSIIGLQLEKNRLKSQEKELQSKKEELTAELQNADDMEYIEEQARKLLKMIKPGEVLYILNGENPRPEGNSESADHVPDLEAKPQETVETTPEETYQEEVTEETVETETPQEEVYAEEEVTEENQEVYEEATYEESSEDEYAESGEGGEASWEETEESYDGE